MYFEVRETQSETGTCASLVGAVSLLWIKMMKTIARRLLPTVYAQSVQKQVKNHRNECLQEN